jgi:hypothetical protein
MVRGQTFFKVTLPLANRKKQAYVYACMYLLKVFGTVLKRQGESVVVHSDGAGGARTRAGAGHGGGVHVYDVTRRVVGEQRCVSPLASPSPARRHLLGHLGVDDSTRDHVRNGTLVTWTSAT